MTAGDVDLEDRVCETLRDRMSRGMSFLLGLTTDNHPACGAARFAGA